MMNLKYAFFSGCVTPQKENSYELSIRKVCQKLGIELVDLEKTNCCGFFVEPVDYQASVMFGARNLAMMDEAGLDAVTPCSACFGHLTRVRSLLLESKELRSTVNQALKEINMTFAGSAKIKHIVGMLLQDVGIERIKDSVSKPLNKLKIAPHYGCHILKPSDELHLDNPEDPKLLDSLIEATGAECVDYSEKQLCCGSSAMNVDQKIATKIIETKLDSIKNSGADAIATVCPACHVQFDLTAFGLLREKSTLPILHYTQLLGLAQGWGPQELGLYENRVSVDRLLEILQL